MASGFSRWIYDSHFQQLIQVLKQQSNPKPQCLNINMKFHFCLKSPQDILIKSLWALVFFLINSGFAIATVPWMPFLPSLLVESYADCSALDVTMGSFKVSWISCWSALGEILVEVTPGKFHCCSIISPFVHNVWLFEIFQPNSLFETSCFFKISRYAKLVITLGLISCSTKMIKCPCPCKTHDESNPSGFVSQSKWVEKQKQRSIYMWFRDKLKKYFLPSK